MKTDLINAASLVIPNTQMLVNVVSRRVRQLSLGHRPLVTTAPGMQSADIALTEIIAGKLTYEVTLGSDKSEAGPPVKVVAFPDATPAKKKAA
jgi:DNA-directed RNA polymerase subunit omega